MKNEEGRAFGTCYVGTSTWALMEWFLFSLFGLSIGYAKKCLKNDSF